MIMRFSSGGFRFVPYDSRHKRHRDLHTLLILAIWVLVMVLLASLALGILFQPY